MDHDDFRPTVFCWGAIEQAICECVITKWGAIRLAVPEPLIRRGNKQAMGRSFRACYGGLGDAGSNVSRRTSVTEAVSTSTSTFPLQVTFRFSGRRTFSSLVVGYQLLQEFKWFRIDRVRKEERQEEAVTAFRSTAKSV
jgi:hypothetical protein